MSDFLERISGALAHVEPHPRGLRLAAVSVVLDDRRAPSVLLIRRAERPGDPWSGQIAFPGGKMQDGDGSARGTAVRETFEELGFDLSSSAKFLGYGGTTTTHTGTMDVIPVVFELEREVPVRPNGEVASFRWVGLGELTAPAARSSYIIGDGGSRVELPAFTSGDYVVWGLTHRILTSLLRAP